MTNRQMSARTTMHSRVTVLGDCALAVIVREAQGARTLFL